MPNLLESVGTDTVHAPTSTATSLVATSLAAEEPQQQQQPQQQTNMAPMNVITIDDDNDDAQPSWKQPNSMKIEALISGPSTEKKD